MTALEAATRAHVNARRAAANHLRFTPSSSLLADREVAAAWKVSHGWFVAAEQAALDVLHVELFMRPDVSYPEDRAAFLASLVSR